MRRERHTATLLPDGRVLIVGGIGARDGRLLGHGIAEAEVRDPSSGKFASAGQAAVGRILHTATLLDDGRVLITGGFRRSEDAEPVRRHRIGRDLEPLTDRPRGLAGLVVLDVVHEVQARVE